MNSIETIEYGVVINSTLLKIFGDEMTYNELKFYSENKDDNTFLKIEFNRNTETQLVRVWFDNQVVMDKKYSLHHSCDMFFYLSEMESEREKEEEEKSSNTSEISVPKKKPLIIEDDEEEEDDKEEPIVHTILVLTEKLQKAGIPTLVSIYGEQFKRKLTNMNASSIPLQKRKDRIIAKIIERCVTDEICQTIFETYFAKKEKPQKDASWLNDFVVDEEILVLNAKQQDARTYSKTIKRKGKIVKINKTSISVRLYAYTEIDDENAIVNQTHGTNKLKWCNFTNDSQVIYTRNSIIKKGEYRCYDEMFVEGEKSVDYGN